MMLMPRAYTRTLTIVIAQAQAEPYRIEAHDTYSFCLFEHISVIVHAGITCHITDVVPRAGVVVRAVVYHVRERASLVVSQLLADGLRGAVHTAMHAAEHSTTDYRVTAQGVLNLALPITVYVQGSYAHMRVRGALRLHGVSAVVCTTQQIHEHPASMSTVYIKGALHDHAQLQYHGAITIAKEAQYTNAQQKSAVLLLSKTARTRALPSLQVLANQVKCTHGSAVGRFDETQQWYLQSRGVPEARIRTLLLEAFFADMV